MIEHGVRACGTPCQKLQELGNFCGQMCQLPPVTYQDFIVFIQDVMPLLSVPKLDLTADHNVLADQYSPLLVSQLL